MSPLPPSSFWSSDARLSVSPELSSRVSSNSLSESFFLAALGFGLFGADNLPDDNPLSLGSRDSSKSSESSAPAPALPFSRDTPLSAGFPRLIPLCPPRPASADGPPDP